MRRLFDVFVCAAASFGCPSPPPDAPPADTEDAPVPEDTVESDVPEVAAAPAVVRRLSVAELDATLADLLGVVGAPATATLPSDARVPFDDAVEYQEPSSVWIEAAQRLADTVATGLVADVDRFATVVGCPPTGDVEACVDAWLPRFLRLALKREIAADELAAWRELTRGDDVSGLGEAVEVVVRAALQDPEFLYRIEQARSVDDPRLLPAAVAGRLSFLLWGRAPDAALLDAAAAGGLDTPEGRRRQADRLLKDPRARAQVDRFHALWLGYDAVDVPPALAATYDQEADRFVERVLFDFPRPWTEILVGTMMPIVPQLVEERAYPTPQKLPDDPLGWTWVDTKRVGRGGVLGTGTWLNASSRAAETSPTMRGKLVLERLLCTPVPPPPAGVRTDAPPAPGTAMCQSDRYALHRTEPGCASCHASMDGIGLGLEQYDRMGRPRAYEYVENQGTFPQTACPIVPGSTVPGLGDYTDVLGLQQLLVDSGRPQDCMVEHLVAFAYGVEHGNDLPDTVDALQQAFRDGGFDFDELLRDVVADETFARVEVP